MKLLEEEKALSVVSKAKDENTDTYLYVVVAVAGKRIISLVLRTITKMVS